MNPPYRRQFGSALWLFGFLLFLQQVHSIELLPIPDHPRYLKSPESLIEKYIQANGGLEHVKSVNSIRLIGKVEEGDIIYDVVLIKKRPNYRRMILRWLGRSIHMGFNGSKAWRFLSTPAGEMEQPMTDSEIAQFIADSQFDGPLVEWQSHQLQLNLVGLAILGRQECYVLDTVTTGGKHTRLFIDAKHFTELRVETRSSPDSPDLQITSLSEYKQVNSIWLAMKIDRYTNDKLVSRMSIETAELNFGVFDDYFDLPQSVEKSK